MTNSTSNQEIIVGYLQENPGISSRDIFEAIGKDLMSYSTMQRELRHLVALGYLETTGAIKSTKYSISNAYNVLREINTDEYFKKEIDDRHARTYYNFDLVKTVLNKIELFTPPEIELLNSLHKIHEHKISQLSDIAYRNALETFSIDLSWKSSQIEGNTYSLLDTEELLKNKTTAAGKTKDEAVMLLNHKETIDFLVAENGFNNLSLRKIEEVHNMLIKELGVERNIRKRTVAISGTNYRPPDNDFQIIEAMEEMCALVNLRQNVFEKALLVLLLISYIQPFVDGNKRTARIVSNAMLWGKGHCPVSFRTVSPVDYKKAMLIFYEQNSISVFKKIFIEQFQFAVRTYF